MCHDIDLLRPGLVYLETGYTHFLGVTDFDGMSPQKIMIYWTPGGSWKSPIK